LPIRFHTHWQVTQNANTQTKTCQRVWLSQPEGRKTASIQQQIMAHSRLAGIWKNEKKYESPKTILQVNDCEPYL